MGKWQQASDLLSLTSMNAVRGPKVWSGWSCQRLQFSHFASTVMGLQRKQSSAMGWVIFGGIIRVVPAARVGQPL